MLVCGVRKLEQDEWSGREEEEEEGRQDKAGGMSGASVDKHTCMHKVHRQRHLHEDIACSPCDRRALSRQNSLAVLLAIL